MMSADVAGPVSVGLSIYANRQEIIQTLKRFRRFIQGGRWRVPVFGAGGTGKTTLARFLAGESDTDVAISHFRASILSETFTLPGSVPVVFIVAPGQDRYRSTNWPELYKLLSSSKARTVINVVSWGHHSVALEYKAHGLYSEGLQPSEFKNRYLDHNRRDEIVALNELVPHLESTTHPLSMITLVTKQDLWWQQRNDVKRYYEDGDYGDRIRRIEQTKGFANFHHEYYYVSLIPLNLETSDRVELAVTTAGYDQRLRIANLNLFVQGLNDFFN